MHIFDFPLFLEMIRDFESQAQEDCDMPEDYYSHPRPEVCALVPAAVRFVVDVGCGAGGVGAALKLERPGVEVRGMELDPEAAARARLVLDDVATARGEAEIPASWPVPDCVIFADVLEHMVDPWGALRAWRSRVRDDGCIVVSLPNVACSQILLGLLRGRWDYEDEGILDRTHLRFFTRRTALEMVRGAGFEVEVMDRAIQKPRTLSGRLVRPWLQLGLWLERRGHTVPAWLLWIVDTYSRQILLRARCTQGPPP